MCGRFTLRVPLTVLIEHFQLGLDAARQLALFEPRYNIAPTQEILAVRTVLTGGERPKSGQREAAMLRWGLIPSWSKEPHGGPPMINARGESIAEKPSFRTATRQRRCLIAADGFYEWKKISGSTGLKGGGKQPYYIHYRDNRPFAFAGLWETWRAKGVSPDEGLTIESCTIVTTAASAALSELHDRMPVILEPGDYALWLDPQVQDPAAVAQLVAPNDDEAIIAEPVSTHVNRVANDDPGCVAVQRSLFD